MNSGKKTARIIGALFLLQFILGIVVTEVWLGPITFNTNFLTKTAANPNLVIFCILLNLILGFLNIVPAVILYPLFKKYNKSIAIGYIAICIISFCLTAMDNLSVSSLLAISKEYLATTSNDASYFKTLAGVFIAIRWQTHMTVAIVGFFSYFILSCAFIQTKLIPRFLLVWALIASVLGMTELVLMFFGVGGGDILFLPNVLNRACDSLMNQIPDRQSNLFAHI